jgi:hypothetical protein
MKPCCWQYVGCELRVEQACSAGQCDDRSVAVTFVFDVSRGMTYVPHTVRVKCNVHFVQECSLTDTPFSERILGSWSVRRTSICMNIFKQDATILSWLLFQELYMFRAFTMPIIGSALLHRQSLV